MPSRHWHPPELSLRDLAARARVPARVQGGQTPMADSNRRRIEQTRQHQGTDGSLPGGRIMAGRDRRRRSRARVRAPGAEWHPPPGRRRTRWRGSRASVSQTSGPAPPRRDPRSRRFARPSCPDAGDATGQCIAPAFPSTTPAALGTACPIWRHRIPRRCTDPWQAANRAEEEAYWS